MFNTWNDIDNDNKNRLKTYYDRFENFVTPKSITVFARYKFHNRVQESSDTFDKFVTDLKLLDKDCGYDKPDEMVRDRIVFGIKSQKVREKLLHKGSDLTVDQTIDIAHAFELSETTYNVNVKSKANQRLFRTEGPESN